ncbi:MAG: glycosyl hydrolase [Candidatus Aminicenantes bacterium]|nr:glycosyl hydrolase [Candidatus Aminicenantes bacterium]
MKKALICMCLLLLVLSSFGWEKETEKEKPALLNPGTYSGLCFRGIGPALMSGRIADIAVHPEDQSVWYVAVGSGGVWKSENAGTTWMPVFDEQPVYSIGCVTLDSNNPEVVWVGTGENVSGRHVGWGDGIYRSLNGGKTWDNMGLKKTQHISKIIIDPNDSDIIYVAAEGPLWSEGGERGVYKSTDGGKNWNPALEISKDTGVTDIALDPSNPDILYAAAYQRRRSVAAFIAGGPESGIYKSLDAGKNWRKLAVGLPKGDMGRIGLAVSPHDPDVVYATIEAGEKEKGFYRSADKGESWEKRDSYISNGTGPHYYQEIFADPHEFDRIYQMDVWMHVTDDGGKTWKEVGETHKHSDNHALAFDPNDPDYLLSGCDGGIYETWDRGKTWKFLANFPVTQFYKMAIDNDTPFYNVIGGAQDNSTQLGPSRTLNENGIRNSDWEITTGGDGYACTIDPEDPNIIYSEWQVGRLSRYDKRSGELVFIQPQPGKSEDAPRWNWDSPIIISPHAHTRLYYASQRVYRSNDRGDSWTPISPDLTRNIARLEQPIMGKTWSVDSLWDLGAMSIYSTISSISESSLVEGLIYAGTDDGLIQVTEDGGKTWRKVEKIPGVPDYYFVNEIRASKHDKDTVYAALDNHKTGDLKPYLLKSTDRGRTWTSIVGDLPKETIVWAITQDHITQELLFIGTEFGIYFTLDEGKQWIRLTGGLPNISFRDLEIQERESDLVGASFGRGIYILDDYSPLREINEAELKQESRLFPVKKALMYIERMPLDLKGKAFLGDAYYLAPNPPFGAVFTYYLKDTLQKKADSRRENEKKLEKEGKQVAFPGWEKIRMEEREEDPAVIITVKDEEGQIVRRLTGAVSKGINRIAWDFRYPSVDPTQIEERPRSPWEEPPRGPLVVPGKFSVSIAKRLDGVLTPLTESQTFIVESLGLQSLPAKDRAALLAFQKKAGDLQRAMMGAGQAAQEAMRQIKFMKKALMDTPKAGTDLGEKVRKIEEHIQDLMMTLYGDWTKMMRSEATSPSLMQRVSAQLNTTAPITETVKRNYEIAAGEFGTYLEELRKTIDVDLKKIGEEMEAAGAPWTPGRGVPKWDKK